MSNEHPEKAGEHAAWPPLLAVELALNLSISSVIGGGLCGRVLEEATTGALIGAISSNIRWASELAGPDVADRCHWTLYSKSGDDLSSETWTGADFSLILRLSPDHFRVATFQAKRESNKRGGFSLIQISPARNDFRPEPQLIRMLRHSGNYGNASPSEFIAGASWVHFLIYRTGLMSHVSLADMAETCQAVCDFDEKQKITERIFHGRSGGLFTANEIANKWREFEGRTYTHRSLATLLSLFERGLRTPIGVEARGWRNLEGIDGMDGAKAFVEATAPHSLIVEVASGPSYSPIISMSESIKVLTGGITVHETIAEIKQSLEAAAARPTEAKGPSGVP